MKKKLFAKALSLALAALMLFALCACGRKLCEAFLTVWIRPVFHRENRPDIFSLVARKNAQSV